MYIELDTDCQVLKTALLSKDWDAAFEGDVIREVKFLISSGFRLFVLPQLVMHHVHVML